jgi:chromosome segregation and condensation protein ScpB
MIEPGAIKVQTAFRLYKDLIHRLKMMARKENRSLNNYVETVLMNIAYNDPNDETIEAIEEARSGKPMEKLDVDSLEGFVAKL